MQVMEAKLQKLIDEYKVSAEATDIVAATRIVLLVGISGAGKDTIKHKLLKTGKYHHIVSHTTREPRENSGVLEKDGVDYHFISKARALEMLENNEFVEAKQYGNNVYGTSVAEIQKARDDGKIAITDIEVQGVAEYKAISSNVIAQFILPPNYDEWQRRLRERYGVKGIDPEDLKRRTQTAITELKEALNKNYYHFVISDDLNEAVSSANSIAHHHDKFTNIDRSFSVWAEKLLEELQQHV